MKSTAYRAFALAATLALVVTISASVTSAASRSGKKPDRVVTKTGPAVEKLAPALQQKVDAGSTASVPVFVTTDDAAAARVKALLENAHTASRNGFSLVVGRIGVQKLPKLASFNGVEAVGAVDFRQTSSPTNDPSIGRQPAKRVRNEALKAYFKREVPYAKAPPLKGSNFEALKKLNVLDAKTHRFADAWKAGYTGEGTTVSVLDGGTDWGHPDLIGTWQTWSSDSPDPGWTGWPKAFDPYGTLLFLVAPELVDRGLSWYTTTTPETASCPRSRRDRDGKRTCAVDFATRLGPSRNFAAPDETASHTYSFPASWSKSGNVYLSSHPDDYLLQLYGERPAVLLTDPSSAGVYDTVYVDLDDDFDFGDEKPVTKSSPVSYRDVNGDGYTDLSGGLLYFIADGETTIPGGLTDFGDDTTPAAASMLAWTGDFDTSLEGHGTLTASNIVGQGVVNGKAPSFADLPDGRDSKGGGWHTDWRGDWRKSWWWQRDDDGGTYPGAVIGGAPRAKLAPMGDIYFSFDFSTQLGYILTTGHGVDVTSNSYGSSDADNDGFDAASQEGDIWHFGTSTTPLFATGNGAPGFGTATAPAPFAGIQVGASTQFGATGWDSIARYSQVVDNDVIEWSNRGPGATGRPGVDVVADGSFSAGDATLNSVVDGQTAWTTWGGTSRSTPVAVAATALVYQAYRQTHPGPLPSAPGSEFWRQSKQYLKSSALDLGYDSFVQGSGSVDAARAAKAAAGAAPSVSPSEWQPGNYRGAKYSAFPRVLPPGGSDTQTFTVANPGSSSLSISDRMLQKVATDSFDYQSASVAKESPFNFNAPDYLIDITNRIKAHPDADLVVIRANYPHAQFDGDDDYQADQAWRLLAYNWTDVNRDRRLWTDRNQNGVVNHEDLDTSSNIDGFPDIDFRHSELEQGEYVRFFYHRTGSNALTGFIRQPAQRMADGIFVGFQHSPANPAIDRTDFKIEIDYYKNVDWPWVTTTPLSGTAFTATINVPSSAPYGMYEGAVVASGSAGKTVVPISLAVAATAPQDAAGNVTGSLTFGGDAVATAQSTSLYNNGSFFGADDWTWRAESGDWRFFFYDVAKAPPAGTLFLADTTWNDAFPTDLDTLLMGRSANDYQLAGPGAIYAPYILDTLGASPNAYLGSGTWLFNTGSGGPEDIVVAPATEGLNSVVAHGVHYNGDRFDVPFKVTLGSANVSPSSVTRSTTTNSGSFDVTFRSSLGLAGLKAEGYGLSQPGSTTETAHQDDPDDPATASIKRDFTLAHASQATFSTDLAGNDIDLYVLYDANNDGVFTSDEVVGSSASSSGVESVKLVAPPDGHYQVWVHGFAVTGSPAFHLANRIVQGNDLTVSGLPAGAVTAGTPVTIHVTYSKTMTAGQSYLGEILLGPPTAPRALSVPVTINRT